MRRLAVLLVLVAWPALGAQEEPPFPAPGRMVDVGGWSLHLNCTGEAPASQSTIILEAGAGDFSVEWSRVQPAVAGFARVCSYDRAGDGWSQLGPHPRTMKQLVYELHTLLEKAGERPPFVLVGQSFGGVVVRLYAATYPSKVAGMMLVDAGRLDPWRFINGTLVQLNTTATGRPVPEVKTANPLLERDLAPETRAHMQAAARSLVTRANESREKLPIEAQKMRTWALGTVKHIAAYVNPFEAEELALMLAAQKQQEYPLGDVPLVVLTAGRVQYDEPGLQDDHQRSQAALARLSRRGKQIIAKESGHHIHIDEPALVIEALRELLAASTSAR